MYPVPPHFAWGMVIDSARAMVNQPYIDIFLWTVMADLLTGIVKSFSKRAETKAKSSIGLYGLAKHLLIMMLVLTVYPLLDTLGFTQICNTVVLFYIAEYAISIIENLDVMGFPIPQFLRGRFEDMAKDADKEKGSKK